MTYTQIKAHYFLFKQKLEQFVGNISLEISPWKHFFLWEKTKTFPEVALLEENAAAENVTVAASLEEKEVAATDLTSQLDRCAEFALLCFAIRI